MKRLYLILLLACLVMPAAALQETSVLAVFHISNGRITPVSSEIGYGKSPNNLLDSGDYIATTVSGNGSYERAVWIEDPTLFRYREFDEGEPSGFRRDNIDFSVVLPYRENTAKVAIYDRDKKMLAEADLGSAKNAFCMAHSLDERCRGTAALWGAGIIVILTVIGAGAYLLLKQKKPAA